MDTLSFLIDTAQTRLKHDRISTLVSGNDWGRRFRQNAYVDPITRTAMLMPLPLTPEWYTNFSGDYARLGLSGLNLTASDWLSDPIVNAADGWIKGKSASGNTPEVVKTKANQPRNGSMWLAWYAANSSEEDWIQMECGYGAADGNDPLSLRIYASGKCEVWRFGQQEATYNITGSLGDEGVSSQTAQTFTSILVMPFRRREVLVLSNQGGGFSHLFEDIDANENDPEITPNTPFWFKVPSGLAKVNIAPCKFARSGYVTGIKSYFATPPAAGANPTPTTYKDANGGNVTATLTEADNPNTPFGADGSADIARVRINLTGNGVTTPNVYGALITFPEQTAQTPHSPTTLDPWVTRATIDVPDSPSDVRVSLDLKSPSEIITAGATGLATISNRPLTVRLGATEILNGATEPISYREALDDGGRRLTLDIRDKWKLCENYRFSDPLPLDGMGLSDAFALILKAVGTPSSELDIESIDFTLPKSDSPSRGDWSVLIEAGDTAADWLSRLHENYCGNWFMGFVPTASGIKFMLASPERLGSTSVYTLFDNSEDVLAALGDTTNSRKNLISYTYRSYQDEVLEPEANDVWIIGRDVRTKRPLIAHKSDTLSQDPTLAVAARPDNWLGEVRKYGLYDASISSQAAAERAAEIMFLRLTPMRIIAEFTADLMIKADGTPVWRGDVVTLQNMGDYRIKSLSCQVVREPDAANGNGWWWRPTRYVAERITDPSYGLSTVSGTSLSSVTNAHKLKAMNKSVVRPDAMSRELVSAMPRKLVLL